MEKPGVYMVEDLALSPFNRSLVTFPHHSTVGIAKRSMARLNVGGSGRHTRAANARHPADKIRNHRPQTKRN